MRDDNSDAGRVEPVINGFVEYRERYQAVRDWHRLVAVIPPTRMRTPDPVVTPGG